MLYAFFTSSSVNSFNALLDLILCPSWPSWLLVSYHGVIPSSGGAIQAQGWRHLPVTRIRWVHRDSVLWGSSCLPGGPSTFLAKRDRWRPHFLHPGDLGRPEYHWSLNRPMKEPFVHRIVHKIMHVYLLVLSSLYACSIASVTVRLNPFLWRSTIQVIIQCKEIVPQADLTRSLHDIPPVRYIQRTCSLSLTGSQGSQGQAVVILNRAKLKGEWWR